MHRTASCIIFAYLVTAWQHAADVTRQIKPANTVEADHMLRGLARQVRAAYWVRPAERRLHMQVDAIEPDLGCFGIQECCWFRAGRGL